MININLVPAWFFGYDVVLEIIFAVITMIVSVFSFHIYKLSGQRQPKLLGFSFLFISISYIIQSFVNFSIISKLNENICNTIKILSVNALNTIGMLSHVFLFSLGLVTLTYMTLNFKSKKTYSLMLLLALLAFLFTTTPLPLFYVMSSMLLMYVSLHYLKNYLAHRRVRTLLMVAAFAFLLFGHIHFIFSINMGVYYIIGHILELVAYILIIINLLLVIRR